MKKVFKFVLLLLVLLIIFVSFFIWQFIRLLEPKLLRSSVSPDGNYLLEVYEINRFEIFDTRMLKGVIKDSNGKILNSKEVISDWSVIKAIENNESGWETDWRMTGCAIYGPKNLVCIK